jgi:hypothetical protein
MHRWFWALCRILTLLLFAGVVIAGYMTGHAAAGWCVLALLLVLHASELRVSLRLPATAHFARSRIILMTLLFGFTWWVPVTRGLAS